MQTDTVLPPLPVQPRDTPWPISDWPTAPMPAGLARTRFAELTEDAFTSTERLGETHATLIVQGGRIVYERYGAGFDAASTHHSWSMAKSITHALVGLLKGDGKIDPARPADVPEWREPNDPRAAITLDHLLRMSSGLGWVEEYSRERPSDVIAMLFEAGKDDVAGFAAKFPLAHKPGAHFYYSSGTTNIVSRCAAQASGGSLRAYMWERLFTPLGMSSPIPKFDAAGTFVGSSFCFCTARDFARFGLLYLRDGLWDGRRLLPEGWADYARTPTWQQPEAAAEGRYGAHWWLDVGGPGSFSANGYDGQYIVLVPDLDLILVRHGVTPMDKKDALKLWVGEVVDCWRKAS
jgi:CubicO group peptidase (beta-lactamase class C family)